MLVNACEAAGVGLHALRHSFASNLFEGDINDTLRQAVGA